LAGVPLSKKLMIGILIALVLLVAWATLLSIKANPIVHDANARIGEMIDIVQTHALTTSDVDWPATRRHALVIAAQTGRVESLHESYRYVLRQLKDRHSSLLTPEEYKSLLEPREIASKGGFISVDMSIEGVPAINLSSYVALDEKKIATDAMDAATQFDAALQKSTCGIIIDLTENSGGNMWPMLYAILPILGDGVIGYFIDAEKRRTEIRAVNGTLYVQDAIQIANVQARKSSTTSGRQVAIITGPATASSGEAVLVMLQGKTGLRTFGEPTAGVSSVNQIFSLKDGSALVLTVSRLADRTGRIYDGIIVPDIASKDLHQTSKYLDASQWLKSQCGMPIMGL
jgi:carboxyl-terminal processing protease